ncbi:transporter substrate-binding domain-containing protein [Saccharibacillus sp. CPCC 101409]|uniref:amino acid ABC transporter substrate-binding protein n=1 Tax=Saccharibacillus sp. CPCC 101409 TaxID=3058041 RepID=UPI0026722ECF|nr:transporter substrate-binding domain-containing protein [Saccharibacillus sp. CPCC 101409]MDO3410443.1 transporter substrate-binding domain-containing protein [Saccharibacillus sp. CPCC 101409]
MKKASLLGLVAILMTLLLAACGNNNSNTAGSNSTDKADGSSETAAAAGNSLDKIKAAGKIVIGTEGTYAPFTYHDDKGELTGFDVDIAREVSKRIGVEAEFVEAPWDSLLAGIDAGRFNAVFNEVSIRDDRKEKYDFSDPYISSGSVLIVRNDNTDIKSLADLKGKKSAQSMTSNLADIARENGAEIVAIDGFQQAIDLLNSGRVDATINDNLSFLDLKKQKPDIALKVVDETDDASQSGGVFAKNQPELIEAVNKALADMHSDGTYTTISEKYFGEDVSK